MIAIVSQEMAVVHCVGLKNVETDYWMKADLMIFLGRVMMKSVTMATQSMVTTVQIYVE